MYLMLNLPDPGNMKAKALESFLDKQVRDISGDPDVADAMNRLSKVFKDSSYNYENLCLGKNIKNVSREKRA